MSRAGTTFTKYFSDKKYGGGGKAGKAAEACLEDLKELVDNSQRVDGKLSQTTQTKAKKLMGAA